MTPALQSAGASRPTKSWRRQRRAGQRLDESFGVVKFRSRKNPRQGCFIPATAVSGHGVYYTILGDLRMAETIPDEPKDIRVTLHNGQYSPVGPGEGGAACWRHPSPRRCAGPGDTVLPDVVLGDGRRAISDAMTLA